MKQLLIFGVVLIALAACVFADANQELYDLVQIRKQIAFPEFISGLQKIDVSQITQTGFNLALQELNVQPALPTREITEDDIVKEFAPVKGFWSSMKDAVKDAYKAIVNIRFNKIKEWIHTHPDGKHPHRCGKFECASAILYTLGIDKVREIHCIENV